MGGELKTVLVLVEEVTMNKLELSLLATLGLVGTAAYLPSTANAKPLTSPTSRAAPVAAPVERCEPEAAPNYGTDPLCGSDVGLRSDFEKPARWDEAECTSVAELRAGDLSDFLTFSGSLYSRTTSGMCPSGDICAVPYDGVTLQSPDGGEVRVLPPADGFQTTGQGSTVTGDTVNCGDVNLTCPDNSLSVDDIEAAVERALDDAGVGRDPTADTETSEKQNSGLVGLGLRYTLLFPIAEGVDIDPAHLWDVTATARIPVGKGRLNVGLGLGVFHRPYTLETSYGPVVAGELVHEPRENIGPGGVRLFEHGRSAWSDQDRTVYSTFPTSGFLVGPHASFDFPGRDVGSASIVASLGARVQGIVSDTPIMYEDSTVRTPTEEEIIMRYENGEIAPSDLQLDAPDVLDPFQVGLSVPDERKYEGGLVCGSLGLGFEDIGGGPASLYFEANPCYVWGTAMTGNANGMFGIGGSAKLQFNFGGKNEE
jgi:hypothetical protein